MYKELRFQMLKRHITMQDIATVLGLSRDTISKKINGKSDFTVDEFLRIRNKFFPDISIDTLSIFETC